MNTRDLVICSLFASITAILAQIAIPFPGGVPLTMQTLAVSLAGIMLGSKKGFISLFIYILLGAIGLPVFAQFSGGIQIILGPTGGFILSFPLMAFIIGFICDRTDNKYIIFIAMILGSIANYTIGAAQFAFIMHTTLMSAFVACVVPFIFTGIVKAVLSTIVGIKLKGNKSMQGVLN